MNYSALFTQSNLSTLVAGGYLSVNGSANNGDYITGETKVVDATSANAVLGSKYFADGTYVIETQNKDSQWIRIGVDESGNVVIPAISEDPSAGGCLMLSARPDNSSDEEDKIIPEGAVYYVGVTEMTLNTNGYANSCQVLVAGNSFPSTVSVGDIYVYEDYEYRYGYVWLEEWMPVDILEEALGIDCPDGWAARVIDASKSKYLDMLSSIKGNPVITLVATYAFCENLTTAPKLSDNAEFMPMTFESCLSLTKAPAIPDSVTNMCGTFSGCESLTEAPNIPNGVIDMTSTFGNCTSLTKAPNIPNSVIDMTSTFTDCESLIEVPAIPDGVLILKETFWDCTSLKTAPVLPNSLIDMDSAFRECSALETPPVIPDNVQILTRTFDGCLNLKIAPIIPYGVITTKGLFANCALTTYVNSSDEDGDFSNYIIPNTVTDTSSMFAGCHQLITSPVVPDSVIDMQDMYAFCSSLINVSKLSNNAINCQGAFYDCTSLIKPPEIPQQAINISQMFSCCSSLVEAPVIPQSATQVNSLFLNCSNLTGEINILSPNINQSHYFLGSYKPIIIKVPANSTTYETLINSNFPANVTIETF